MEEEFYIMTLFVTAIQFIGTFFLIIGLNKANSKTASDPKTRIKGNRITIIGCLLYALACLLMFSIPMMVGNLFVVYVLLKGIKLAKREVEDGN